MAKTYATGRRKTSIAKVWMSPGTGKITLTVFRLMLGLVVLKQRNCVLLNRFHWQNKTHQSISQLKLPAVGFQVNLMHFVTVFQEHFVPSILLSVPYLNRTVCLLAIHVLLSVRSQAVVKHVVHVNSLSVNRFSSSSPLKGSFSLTLFFLCSNNVWHLI